MNRVMTMNKVANTRVSARPMVRLLKFLMRGACSEVVGADGIACLRLADGTAGNVAAVLIAEALASGLIDRQAGLLRLCPEARSYLRRAAAEKDEEFLEQHGAIEAATRDVEGRPQRLRINRDESPLASLARLKDRDGQPFLPETAMAAGERLHADFTRGQLQPRVTASWEPRLASRGSGSRGGMADLADSAMAARLAVNRALEALGPELSGVALDICCFMKGLEVVERERQWPVRSAKLMLRTALLALSRHYHPPAPSRRPRYEHWGAEGFRPELYS
jgi:hypothetical protein